MPAGMTSGRADGVDEDGTVVGRIAADDSRTESGYLWLPDGTGRVMEMPEIEGGPADYFWPESISNGWVAGRAVDDRADGSRYFTSLRYRIADGRYKISTFSADGRRLGGYTTDSDGEQVGTEPLLWTCR